MKKIALLSVYILLLGSNVANAAVGKVTEQLNAVASIVRDKSTLNAPKGTGVEMNDTVKTGQGKLGITFEDDTKVQVTENSKLVIDDFIYDPKSKSGSKLAVKVALGTVRYASGQIAKTNPQNVAVTTPTATIGVRGTDFTATVDEVGASTIILLPSCPANYRNKITFDIEKDCKTGQIIVETDVGQVILNQPFQATKVTSRNAPPPKPVILKLTEDAISNILIIAPPKEFDKKETSTKIDAKGALDVDFLKETGLVNALDQANAELFSDTLSRNLLDNTFLINILDMVNAQLAAQLDLLNNTKSGLLPDYFALSGIIATVDEGSSVTLSRDNGSDVMSVTVPYHQNSVIMMNQSNMDFKNRVNTGTAGLVNITMIQK
jgi:hypothetical protein